MVDNFCNSRRSVQARIERISGKAITLHEGDIRDRAFLDGVFATRRFDAVIHFAGLKAVGESVEKPDLYFDNNVRGSATLLAAMEAAGVRRIVFSSSAPRCTVRPTRRRSQKTPQPARSTLHRENKLAIEPHAGRSRALDGWRLSTYGGPFRMIIFRNTIDRTEHVALVKGKIDADKPTLVRMHRVDLAADMLGQVEARRDYVPKALKALAAYDGAGVAVFIRDSNPAWLSERYGQPDVSQTDNVLRDYGVGAQILIDLGVRDMLLLTSSKTVLPGSTGYGLQILGRVPLD